jgi:hypothetical protein
MIEKFANRFAVGIIDADKRRPSYLNNFIEVASSKHLKLFRHSYRPHFIILVHPAADEFILSCAKAAEIDVADYNLPPDFKDFTAQSKNVMSNKDYRFKLLFKSLENFGEFKLLKSLISYFVSTTYKASDEEINTIFCDGEV